MGRGGAILTPNELVLTFRGSYVCANFGENRSRNATVRVFADGQTDTHTHTHTDANRFYNLSHAICYSYGTDNNDNLIVTYAERTIRYNIQDIYCNATIQDNYTTLQNIKPHKLYYSRNHSKN